MKSVSIIGAGVAGLTVACALLDKGIKPRIYEKSSGVGKDCCSWFAGGMLAPWCEQESAPEAVVTMGQLAKTWWADHTDTVTQAGSLVLSPRRDTSELRRFARLTDSHQWVDSDGIKSLEPDLRDTFEQGLFYADEAHLNPRQALLDCEQYLHRAGVVIAFDQAVVAQDLTTDIVIDCRGFGAATALQDLRGVKGEMLILQSQDIHLTRPVRLLHPRYPLYIVPRGEGIYMLGATMVENSERERITALSMLELLSTAYALHPAFGEASIIEIGVDVRPAYRDNTPAVTRDNNVIFVNGLFRHGFLASPALALQAAEAVIDEDRFQELPTCA